MPQQVCALVTNLLRFESYKHKLKAAMAQSFHRIRFEHVCAELMKSQAGGGGHKMPLFPLPSAAPNGMLEPSSGNTRN